MNILIKDYEDFKDVYNKVKAWGVLTSIDLTSCLTGIEDKEYIKKYIIELCDLIDMKRFGDPQIVHFGTDEEVAGFSMTQLIETSLISGHFANKTKNAYIDIFSCKPYNPYDAMHFTQRFFDAKEATINIVFRR